MFKSKTLFVVGAGASKEVNIPIGTELAEEIAHLLYFEFDHVSRLKKGDYKIFDSLKKFLNDTEILNGYLKAARQISEGIYLASSIDNYIDIHQHDSKISLCGKVAIVRTILNAEKNSSLYLDRMKSNEPINFQKIEQTWYVQFAKILFEQVTLDKLDDLFNNIAIVCFNYDRCIQYFLIRAISSLYSIPHEKAQKIVEGIKIFHPYGSIGNLPISGSANGIEFGASTDYLNIIDLSKSIKTYTEQIKENKLLKSLRQEVAGAKTIVFLGFGFHPQNMDILTPKNKTNANRVYATAKGFSDTDSAVIKDQIYSALHASGDLSSSHNLNIQVRNKLSCTDLFSEYKKTLAAN